LKFLFDHNLSPLLARSLHVLNAPLGHSVHALKDKFAQDTGDIEWIEALAKEGDWVVITCDKDIARKGAIKNAWKRCGLIGFVLRPAWQGFPPMEQAWRLMKIWPRVVKQCELAAPGSTYELGIKGDKITTL
jgi:hypothetical protein